MAQAGNKASVLRPDRRLRLVRPDGFLRSLNRGSRPCGSRGGVGCAPTTAWSIVLSHRKTEQKEQELQVQIAAACVAVILLCVEEGFVRGTFDAEAVNGEGR